MVFTRISDVVFLLEAIKFRRLFATDSIGSFSLTDLFYNKKARYKITLNGGFYTGLICSFSPGCYAMPINANR